jgi:riboflavin kinase / FMN adenylyltransferase
MQIIRDPFFMDAADRGAVVAIGNFDGVHLGHRAVIELARDIANSEHAPLGVLTFEPHPRQFFRPEADPFRLMNAAARAHRLEKLKVEKLLELPFNLALSSLSAQEFASQILHGQLGLRHVVVGADFQFGKSRLGHAADLVRFGAELGFGVTIAPMVTLPTGEVSSTAIRAALSDGKPREAAAMLGHWHRIEGPVIRGDQRGRDLGFPTANMSITGLHPPRFGVYAVKVDVLDGAHSGSYNGAASIGVRPMFGVNSPNCESYLFDFKGDLYGANLSVALIDYLRPELKFDGLPALITQMDADCVRARKILTDV